MARPNPQDWIVTSPVWLCQTNFASGKVASSRQSALWYCAYPLYHRVRVIATLIWFVRLLFLHRCPNFDWFGRYGLIPTCFQCSIIWVGYDTNSDIKSIVSPVSRGIRLQGGCIFLKKWYHFSLFWYYTMDVLISKLIQSTTAMDSSFFGRTCLADVAG